MTRIAITSSTTAIVTRKSFAPVPTRSPSRISTADRESGVGRHRYPPPRRRAGSGGDRRKIATGSDHAAERGEDRQRRRARMAQVADDQLALDLERDDEEEDRHQPVVDPVLEVLRDREVAEAERQLGGPELDVGVADGLFTQTSASTETARSRTPPAASVRRNSATGSRTRAARRLSSAGTSTRAYATVVAVRREGWSATRFAVPEPHPPGALSVAIAVATFLIALALIASERLHRTKVALLGAAIVVLFVARLRPGDGDRVGRLQHDRPARRDDDPRLPDPADRRLRLHRDPRRAALEGRAAPRSCSASRCTTALLSAFLDNLTTILLVVPITFLLADALDIDPIPLIVIEVIASNIGGTATLIGDPPNIIIAGATGLSFNEFIVNLAPIVVVTFAVVIAGLYLFYRRQLQIEPKNRKLVMELDAAASIRDADELRRTVPVLIAHDPRLLRPPAAPHRAGHRRADRRRGRPAGHPDPTSSRRSRRSSGRRCSSSSPCS